MFKVSDIVRVKPKEFFVNHPKYNGVKVNFESSFVEDMFQYCNEKFIISKAWFSGRDYNYNCYRVKKNMNDDDYDENCFTWNDWMFEKIDKQLDLFEEN